MFAAITEDNSIVEPQVVGVKNDDKLTSDVPSSYVTLLSHVEPIVSRRELWSYYCKPREVFLCTCDYSDNPSSVYFFGGAVRPL
jgi:hypothetical protein